MIHDSVHPRLRGELHKRTLAIFSTVGSSPLTRGTRSNLQPRSVSYRFIPAYAGNSTSECPTASPTSVHPRLRGELVHAQTYGTDA